ncbi:MAG: glycosyltransferase family 2 protein [Thermoleophilia bacterium]|nr:glycosyltransferase family 2 protein [Thermoleophilia bacterium]
MIPDAGDLIVSYNWMMVGYFLALNVLNAGLVTIGWRDVKKYVKRRPLRDYKQVSRSPLSMPVTILVPSYNEALVIADSVRSLLRSRYAQFEVMVINDGSTDGTMDELRREFALTRVERIPRASIETQPEIGCYVSGTDPGLVVVDKVNGGKADALNVGLRFAAFPLVCAIDADTMLDPAALSRIVWEFQAEPETVAAGGIVRIINGSKVENGKLVSVATPKSLLANLQIMEYLRAFLSGRIAWSRLGMLLIISGAFGIFRRDALVEAGGWDPTTVGEDAELVLRLHRVRRDSGQTCRIVFFPDPICWTEAPQSLKILIRQRDRWQRGLIEMLVRHRSMLGRRKYGRVGTFAIPYFAVFEAFGPFIEVTGYLIFLLALALGLVSWPLALAFLGLSVSFGLVISFTTLLMEERAFRRYPSWGDLGKLVLVAIIENFGYRQILAVARSRAIWTMWRVRGKHTWGDMDRAGFGNVEIPATQPGGVEPVELEADGSKISGNPKEYV